MASAGFWVTMAVDFYASREAVSMARALGRESSCRESHQLRETGDKGISEEPKEGQGASGSQLDKGSTNRQAGYRRARQRL